MSTTSAGAEATTVGAVGAGLDRWRKSKALSVRAIAPNANRNGRNNASSRPVGLLWLVFDRSDGEGKSVMTIDLSRVR